MNKRFLISLSLTAALVAALVQPALAAIGFEEPVNGPAAGDVLTGAHGTVHYAVRQTLHTVLPSTPSTVGPLPQPYSRYNALHRPEWGGFYSGVAVLDLKTTEGWFSCTGSLLWTGRHILTTAHCVTDALGNKTLIDGEAFFPSINTGKYTGEFESTTFRHVSVHPGWAGTAFLAGNDIAVITLDAEAPLSANRYDLYTDSDEIGRRHVKVGWGQVGLGNGSAVFYGGFRKGENTWDETGAKVEPLFGGKPNPDVLYYDFDNGFYSSALGYAPNDAFDYWFGIAHRGLGLSEVMVAPGDSGGPSFIGGKIAGVTSFGLTAWSDSLGNRRILTSDSTDPWFGPDGSFGEFGGDVRVSHYVEWIEAQTIPEPQACVLMLLGLVGVVLRAHRPDRRSRA